MSSTSPDQHPGTVEIAGVRFAAISLVSTVERLRSSVSDGRGEWLLTPNTSIVRRLRRDAACRRLVEGATLVVPDGQPLIWLARLQGTPVVERVTGSDILPLLLRSLPTGTRVGFVGGPAGVAAAAAAVSGEQLGLAAVGHLCPPFGFRESTTAWEAALDAVAAWEAPQVVALGLPFPLQEQFITAARERLPDAVYVGVGAGLTYFVGARARAHPRLQRAGLEWLWRLLQEPRHLARRYLIEDLPFLVGEALRLLARRTGSQAGASGAS